MSTKLIDAELLRRQYNKATGTARPELISGIAALVGEVVGLPGPQILTMYHTQETAWARWVVFAVLVRLGYSQHSIANALDCPQSRVSRGVSRVNRRSGLAEIADTIATAVAVKEAKGGPDD